MDGRSFSEFLSNQQKIRDEHVRLSRKFIEDGVKLLNNEQKKYGYYSTCTFASDDPGLNDGFITFTLHVKSSKPQMKVKRLQDGTYAVAQESHVHVLTDPAQLIEFFYTALVAHEEGHTRLVLGLG